MLLQAVHSLHSHIQAAYIALLMWVQKDKQICMHTYMHTKRHMHTIFGNNVSKQGAHH